MRGDVFDVLVVVHVVVAIVGFGAIALSGVYGLTARRRERPGALEEVRRYFTRPPVAEAGVLGVGVLGIAALLVDPHGRGFGQAWVVVGAVIWLVAGSLWLRVVRPAEAAMAAALAADEVGPAAGEVLDRRGAQLSGAAVATSVLFVVALGFMLFQP